MQKLSDDLKHQEQLNLKELQRQKVRRAELHKSIRDLMPEREHRKSLERVKIVTERVREQEELDKFEKHRKQVKDRLAEMRKSKLPAVVEQSRESLAVQKSPIRLRSMLKHSQSKA